MHAEPWYLIFNLSFNRTDLPLAFYAVFIEKSKSFYYIGNFVYQHFFIFRSLTMCCGCRISICDVNFILKLFQLIDGKNKCGDDMLELINFAIKIHIDVLQLMTIFHWRSQVKKIRDISKISGLFKTSLLIQLIQSLRKQLFANPKRYTKMYV